jgi:hypothetical protein
MKLPQARQIGAANLHENLGNNIPFALPLILSAKNGHGVRRRNLAEKNVLCQYFA